MSEYLIGIMYHDPQTYAQWLCGLTEDYESSTGLFIDADSPEAAVAWGEHVGQTLLAFVYRDALPKGPPAESWFESPAEGGAWKHCLGFFQHVRAGEMPDLATMTAEAYRTWSDRRGDPPPSLPRS